MKKNLNAFLLTLIALFAFSCSDVPSPYDLIDGGNNGGDTELVGTGTKEDPYNLASAMKKQDNSEAWVMGYIVGCVNDKSIATDAVFAAPFENPANILIAESATETDYKKCLAVQLPSGFLRTALNLKDNAGNHGKPVVLKGLLTAYFGVAGLKEVSAGALDGKDITDNTQPEPTGTIFFEEAFATNQGKFTMNNVTLPEGSTYVWQWTSYNSSAYMKASGYVGGANKASEAWLISPSVNLTKATAASLVFEHAYKFGVDKTKELTVWVTESGKNTWVQVTIPTYPTGSDWTFVSSGNISLDSYIGKSIQFAFKYTSSTSGAATWEVKNVKVFGAGEAVPDSETPETPENPGGTTGSNLVLNPGFEDWTADLPTSWDNATYNTGVTKETTIKHGGVNAVKHVATATFKIQQEIAVEAGKTYKVSYWYLDNDANAKTRMWTLWVDAANKTLADNTEMHSAAPYSTDNAEWVQVSHQVQAPATATKLRFEVRTYKDGAGGGAIYYDDFEVSEVK